MVTGTRMELKKSIEKGVSFYPWRKSGSVANIIFNTASSAAPQNPVSTVSEDAEIQPPGLLRRWQ